MLEDSFFEALLKERQEFKIKYEEEVNKYLNLDRQSFEVFKKLNDKDTSVREMIDSYASCKFNIYMTKLESAFKRVKGEVVCEDEMITSDLLDS